MIKIIDSDFNALDEFKKFCKQNSFGTRIYSHYLCYGYEFDFVDFWVQFNDNNDATCVICRAFNDTIISAEDDADFDEISMFLKCISMNSVTFNIKYQENILVDSKDFATGDVLIYKGNDKICSNYSICTPQLKEYHNLLLSCESPDFFVPKYLDFLADVSRRQQHNLCTIYGIRCENELSSCAMTVSYTDFSVILGAVATHKNFRNKGLAGCIVKSLAERFCDSRTVYIYTTIKRNTEFYKSLGFVECGKWIKYAYGGLV